jgi:hypothetical protein
MRGFGWMSWVLIITSSSVALAQHQGANYEECGDWAYYDTNENMCARLARPGDPNWEILIHGNTFVVGDLQTGQRQLNKMASPNFAMLEAGRTVAPHHYFNVDLMLTVERWTFPTEGYPELAQVGEKDINGNTYLDAQHPHSSPLMGLTVSDTISFGEQQNFVKIFAAPRGSSTDGPVSFMHRSTGQANPDAPLGHHLGQDVGHISSTVVGSELKLGRNQFEASVFNGDEPSPTSVDLPLGPLNSLAFRYTRLLSPTWFAMGSIAYVKDAADTTSSRDAIRRYSASVYSIHHWQEWQIHNALIYGSVSHLEGVHLLTSWGDEFLVEKDACHFFGRFEWLERTPAELAIASDDPFKPQSLMAVTGGYTLTVLQHDDLQVGVGGSLSNLLLPTVYQGAYSGNPWTGRLFVQISGMSML